VRDVIDTRFGKVALFRLLLLVVAIPLLLRLFARGPRREYPLPTWWAPLAVVTGFGIAATPGLAGHAASGRWVPFAIVADTLHVLAMALWLGGLVFLVVVVLTTRDVDTLRTPVTNFSRLALGCVGVIVVTGAFQSLRQVGSLSALRDTDYGKLLVLKLLLFGAIVIIAAFSREVVARVYYQRSDGGGPPDVESSSGTLVAVDTSVELRRLRWSVGIEVAVAIAILAVTAMLVNTPPARETATGPFSETVTQGGFRYEVIVTPAAAGTNEVHVTVFTSGGGPTDPVDTTAEMSQGTRDIAPIDVPLDRLGPGHYVANGFSIPFGGDWTLTIKTLVTEVDEETLELTVPIR
jgi:copper transport protein